MTKRAKLKMKKRKKISKRKITNFKSMLKCNIFYLKKKNLIKFDVIYIQSETKN